MATSPDPHTTGERVYAALDIETTGLNTERDAIIEVAIVRFTRFGVLDSYHTLVRPAVEIPVRVTQITGLTGADLTSAPDPADVLPAVERFVGDATIVGHSVEFDLRFLQRHGILAGHTGADTFELATILVPDAPRHGLATLMAYLELPMDGHHRALADAHSARRLFLALADRAATIPADTLAVVARLCAQSDWPLAHVFTAAYAGLTTGGAGEATGGRAPFRDPAWHRRPAQVLPEGELAPAPALDPDELAARLAPDAPGAASGELEDRPGQRRMLQLTARALTDGDRLLIEAGTGTGKSLAYLLPAAAWAHRHGEPVVISTHTIALQHQLMEKDIPLAAARLGRPVRAAVLKGRAQYLCRSRLASLAARTDVDASAVRSVVKILVWAARTTTGDRTELRLQPHDMPTWRSVSAEGDACTPSRCPYAREGECFVQRARRNAEGMDLVIVNHALLVSDALVARKLLPAATRLVVDEAHHLEAVTTTAVGFRASESSLREALEPVSARTAGLPARLAAALMEVPPGPNRDRALDRTTGLAELAASTAPLVGTFFRHVAGFMGDAAEEVGVTLRLTRAVRHNPAWESVEAAWDDLHSALGLIRGGLSAAGSALEAPPSMDPGLLADLAAAQRLLAESDEGLHRCVTGSTQNDVIWIERGGAERLSLRAAPLHVGQVLAARVWSGREGLVLTSATLRLGADFTLIAERLGMPEAAGVVVDSPFDYASCALMYTATDIAEPGQGQYSAQLNRTIIDLAAALGGRTLVLFTSHSELRGAYHGIRGPLGSIGIAVLAQGIDGSRTSLLEGFQDPETQTVLLGTRSFWEGIDVRGDPLSVLVITRLPFDVPTDPVFAARADTYDDPFLDYAVPQAVLRFRQGVGRLIRSTHDRGVVAVLDRRIVARAYGEAFFDALPPIRRRSGPVAALAGIAARFVAGEPLADETEPPL